MNRLVSPAEAVFLDAKLESELGELDDEEAMELLQSVGQEESGLNALARVGFAALGELGHRLALVLCTLVLVHGFSNHSLVLLQIFLIHH